MREILFRGKRTDNSEWLYGDLQHHNEQILISPIFTEPYEYPENYNENVLPKTIGQFTNFLDKNGKQIFEGDIIAAKSSIGSGIFIINYEAQDLCWNNGFYPFNIKGYCCLTHIAENDLSNVEIIGNIHDNHELLEGRND